MTTYYRIPTPAGVLLAWSNGRREDGSTHVGVRTETAHGRYTSNAPVGGWDDVAESMTFSRVAYRVQEHYGYTLAGLAPVSYAGHNPLTRAEAFSLADGTPAAVRAYRATVEPAIVEWLASDDGRAMIAAGERERVASERARLTRERADLADKLAAVDAALAALPAV